MQPQLKERCQSGRMDRTRNAAYSYGYPGFESQSLRTQKNWLSNQPVFLFLGNLLNSFESNCLKTKREGAKHQLFCVQGPPRRAGLGSAKPIPVSLVLGQLVELVPSARFSLSSYSWCVGLCCSVLRRSRIVVTPVTTCWYSSISL